MKLTPDFLKDSEAIHERAMRSLFEEISGLCEGVIIVDRDARIIWISDKYVKTLGLQSAESALGKPVEDVIPNSVMRRVVQTGEPMLLDVMEFGERSFVVTRIPVRDDGGEVIGAIGYVLYDRLNYLKPLVEKFTTRQVDIAQAKRKLAEDRRPKYTLSSFIGSSPACSELKRQARRAAEHDSTVLLLGETGVGKELLAHAIHAASARAAKPFVAVNMAAVPETLLEAEFFGTAPGAYTGADRGGREGKFKLADGGTLFLDEVGDMPLQLQGKLLRVLQEQEFEPLGSNNVTRVDVRVIAATAVDLTQMIADGKFRNDLYYRLNVLRIRIPPLRERLTDLEALCDYILDDIAERTGLPRRELAPTALTVLRSYDWPGNVRELRNVLEQAALFTDNVRLSADDLAGLLPAPAAVRRGLAPAHAATGTLTDAVTNAERDTILASLNAAGGHVADAARRLGISRATLYKKLQRLNLVSTNRD